MNIFLAYMGPVSMLSLLATIGVGVFAFVGMFLGNLINGWYDALEEAITYGLGAVSLVASMYAAGVVVLGILGLFGVLV